MGGPVFHNTEYKEIIVNLLGKDMSDLPPEEVDLNNSLLYDLNMGYENRKNIHPLQAVRFNRVEAKYVHPWSYENIGEQFGELKLHEFIPLRDYLELPANAVDRVIKGVIKGRESRRVADEEARREAARRQKEQQSTANVHSADMDPVTAEMIRQLNTDQQ